MKKILAVTMLVIAMMWFGGIAQAGSTTTIYISPIQVPDEKQPRVNSGDAPTGFGPDSWQNSATGKVNWHARYNFDGDFLSALFPSDAATLTFNDIESISYWTKRPTGTLAGRDWALYLYTRPSDGEYSVKGSGDDSAWYGKKFMNDPTTHTDIGNWTEYSTANGMLFSRTSGATTPYKPFGDFKPTYGTELVEMISVQTWSNWSGTFDGYMDGLTITLTNGNVGKVNFVAPEPGTLMLLGFGLIGLAAARRKR